MVNGSHFNVDHSTRRIRATQRIEIADGQRENYTCIGVMLCLSRCETIVVLTWEVNMRFLAAIARCCSGLCR